MSHPLFDRRAVFASIACLGAGGVLLASRSRARPQSARPDLYHCEGCDGALERNSRTLNWQTQIASIGEPGERMRIEGLVLRHDGKTPAPGVVIYAYHTNSAGLYANGTPETEWSRRHGRLRGWVKTDQRGHYAFDTIKPAPYPHETIPAHVHLTVLEPNRRPYYIDDIVFAGEFGVTPDYVRKQELRGGSGIIHAGRTSDGRLLARRNIILELHPSAG